MCLCISAVHRLPPEPPWSHVHNAIILCLFLQTYYPFNYILPHTGDMFTYCGRASGILDWRTNTWKGSLPGLGGKYGMQFPYTGSSVLLGLYPDKDYAPTILVLGGNQESVSQYGNL